MSISGLPSGGANFRMEGVSGFKVKLNSLIRYGELSSLQDNKDLILSIFEGLQDNIRRYGKISAILRRQAHYRFINSPNTTKDDERKFKKILDNYK